MIMLHIVVRSKILQILPNSDAKLKQAKPHHSVFQLNLPYWIITPYKIKWNFAFTLSNVTESDFMSVSAFQVKLI